MFLDGVSLWLDELEVLIRGEESDEHWHLDDLDITGLVNIEMSPSLGEISSNVGIEFSITDFLVGAENFLSSGGGGGLVHPESTGWGTILILSFESVLRDH